MKLSRILAGVALSAGLIAAPALGGSTSLISEARAAAYYDYFNGSANVGARVNSSPGTIQGGRVYVLGWAGGPFISAHRDLP